MPTTQQTPPKALLQAIHADIDAALSAIAGKHHLANIKTGTVRDDASGFRVTVEGMFDGAEPPEMTALRERATLLGFSKAIAGAAIQYAGKDFKVVGVRRTQLSLQSSVDGKTYLAPIDQVRKALQRQNSSLLSA